MRKEANDISSRSPSVLIGLWCLNHPEDAHIGYQRIIEFLFLDHSEQILSESDDFPSGSKTIDHITSELEFNGLGTLIQAIQLREHGAQNMVSVTVAFAALRIRGLAGKSWRREAHALLRAMIDTAFGYKVKGAGCELHSGSGNAMILVLEPTRDYPVRVMFANKDGPQIFLAPRDPHELMEALALTTIREAIVEGDCVWR